MQRIAIGFLVAAGIFTVSAVAQEAAPTAGVRKIEVRGIGEIKVPTNELVLPVELVTAGDDFGALKRRNDAVLKQLVDLLTAHKVAHPPLDQTRATFDFSPVENYRQFQGPKGKNFNVPNQIAPNDPFGGKDDDGESPAKQPMRMSRRLVLQFKDLEHATALLAKLTELEAVHKTREISLAPLQSSLSSNTVHLTKARQLAVEQAQKKAQELARASQLQLGLAMSISDESTVGGFRPTFSPADPFGEFGVHSSGAEADERATPRTFVAFQAEAPALSTESAPGQVVVSVTVRIVYEAHAPK